MNQKIEIINFCNSLGLDTVGFTKCRIYYELRDYLKEKEKFGELNEFEEKDIEKRINPFIYMPQGKTIISIAFPYYFGTSSNTKCSFSVYTFGNDYHNIVKSYLKKICEFIENLGGKAEGYVDSNALPERYIAYLSGIGFIGRNNMLITKKYGSFVFLGEIITDLELPIEENTLEAIDSYKDCGECKNCIEACPTKAINLKKKNSNICLAYITQKKHIEDYWLKKIEGRLFGCDSCQNSCPYNKEVEISPIKEFKPNDFMVNPDLNAIVNIDNKAFKETFGNSSCSWRGKSLLQRNALIVAKNNGSIINVKDIKSPYVKEYYNRLLELK